MYNYKSSEEHITSWIRLTQKVWQMDVREMVSVKQPGYGRDANQQCVFIINLITNQAKIINLQHTECAQSMKLAKLWSFGTSLNLLVYANFYLFCNLYGWSPFNTISRGDHCIPNWDLLGLVIRDAALTLWQCNNKHCPLNICWPAGPIFCEVLWAWPNLSILIRN